jgi:hypothetical protein
MTGVPEPYTPSSRRFEKHVVSFTECSLVAGFPLGIIRKSDRAFLVNAQDLVYDGGRIDGSGLPGFAIDGSRHGRALAYLAFAGDSGDGDDEERDEYFHFYSLFG